MALKHKVIGFSSESHDLPNQGRMWSGCLSALVKVCFLPFNDTWGCEAKCWVITDAKEQTLVNDHFNQANPEDLPVLYSDVLFKDVAIRWLIKRNQVFYFPFLCATCSLSHECVTASVCIWPPIISAYISCCSESYLWYPDTEQTTDPWQDHLTLQDPNE